MSANADDLRNWYAEAIGPSITLTAGSAAAVKNAVPLDNGRYRIQFHTLTGAVSKVWCRQGPQASVVATKADPSMPVEVIFTPRPFFFVMVRDKLDGLSFIVDSDTCDVTITKVSRGKN